MVNSAKKKYPSCKFKQGDALESMLYPSNSFSTITCSILLFIILMINNYFYKTVIIG